MTRQLSDQLCACGCGQRTFVALKTNRTFGHVKGQPLLWRRGHQARSAQPYELAAGPFVEPCWLWTGCLNSRGYAVVSVLSRRVLAHRWLWEREHGPVPEGHDLHHLCETKRCVNPLHLVVVSRTQHRALRRREEAIHA